MTDNIIGSSYHNVHHFISKSKWSALKINERRLKLMNKCNQTRVRNNFALIITEIDYLITNESESIATGEWIVKTFSKRNYLEKFDREAKGWLGLKEYQVRKKEAFIRHFILVFTAYTFIVYQQLMGGVRKRYANKSLRTFTETLEAFLTGVSYNFLGWLQDNLKLFAEHKASQEFIWG